MGGWGFARGEGDDIGDYLGSGVEGDGGVVIKEMMSGWRKEGKVYCF